MRQLNNGDHGEDVGRLQRSTNRRLASRQARNRQVKSDGHFGPKTRDAVVYAAFLLGMSDDDLKHIRVGDLTVEEQKFVMNPGNRNQYELERGRKRVAAHIRTVKKQEAEAKKASGKRQKIVREAEKAAANYRRRPGAYHYLAGGRANLAYLNPTPRSWRSDCSQFVGAVYKGAGASSPALPLAHQWSSTYTIVASPHARVIPRSQRRPGDLGMYGSRHAPHHVEIWCGNKFIGHGSPPIDSLTPGEPDFYVTFDFLN